MKYLICSLCLLSSIAYAELKPPYTDLVSPYNEIVKELNALIGTSDQLSYENQDSVYAGWFESGVRHGLSSAVTVVKKYERKIYIEPMED